MLICIRTANRSAKTTLNTQKSAFRDEIAKTWGQFSKKPDRIAYATMKVSGSDEIASINWAKSGACGSATKKRRNSAKIKPADRERREAMLHHSRTLRRHL